MMEGVRFRGDTPGERKNVLKRKKESRGWVLWSCVYCEDSKIQGDVLK